jgi:hypothetical protein
MLKHQSIAKSVDHSNGPSNDQPEPSGKPKDAFIDQFVSILRRLSARRSTANHTVKLIVQDGNFTYLPTMLRVKEGETVEFQSDGPFEIMFKERTPGDKLFLSERDPILTINEDAEYAVYHYAAATHDGVHVFLDSACGDIAVEK